MHFDQHFNDPKYVYRKCIRRTKGGEQEFVATKYYDNDWLKLNIKNVSLSSNR